jgi:hypothetical protein
MRMTNPQRINKIPISFFINIAAGPPIQPRLGKMRLHPPSDYKPPFQKEGPQAGPPRFLHLSCSRLLRNSLHSASKRDSASGISFFPSGFREVF